MRRTFLAGCKYNLFLAFFITGKITGYRILYQSICNDRGANSIITVIKIIRTEFLIKTLPCFIGIYRIHDQYRGFCVHTICSKGIYNDQRLHIISVMSILCKSTDLWLSITSYCWYFTFRIRSYCRITFFSCFTTRCYICTDIMGQIWIFICFLIYPSCCDNLRIVRTAASHNKISNRRRSPSESLVTIIISFGI